MQSFLSWRNFNRCAATLVLIFLVAPILAIVPLSFNGGSFLSYPLDGFSLQWYAAVFESPRWILALKNSLLIGLASMTLATALGTMAALGLNLAEFRLKGLLLAVLLSPMIVPTVITAVGVYFLFSSLGLASTFTGMVLAHTALATPFVVIAVNATLQGLDRSLLRAAASLGAGPMLTFRRVTLPLILPGVASGAVFAFATSFDEVVVSLLLAGPEQRTLPREMFSGVRENLSPSITAVAFMLTLLSTLFLLTLGWLQRYASRMAGKSSAAH
ncbi:ABC transporter permease [Pseudomonas sp. BN414]|uniref:ABC transporter permease n=1 Tax=Pseudomonas sp. BN414 TaxID=2567888 RepID=UPI0024548EC9|nr:ABC transporter permease [Pseudomonas sp. BN414]MDH4567073.1 ABC transporter permease [Pseudomonas sp. BN414]